MLLSSTINDGIVETLNRLCAATVNTYSFKAKMADFNDSLDWYCGLAFKAGLNWEFDDINQTSPPIDTQNLVSGTNRYKVGTFTEKILDLIRLEVLNSAGKGVFLTPETFDTLGSPTTGNASGVISGVSGQTFQELYLNAPAGTPTNYIKFGDFIYLRPNPNYNYTAGLKAYFNRTALKFSFVTFTVTSASPAVFSSTAHGLVAGDTVVLNTTNALYTGLSGDIQYYVISAGLTADAFELSASLGGAAINTSGSQSGTHSYLKTSVSPGIPATHHIALVRKTALTFLNYTNSFKLGQLPQQVQLDERAITDYFAKRGKEIRFRLSVCQENNR